MYTRPDRYGRFMLEDMVAETHGEGVDVVLVNPKILAEDVVLTAAYSMRHLSDLFKARTGKPLDRGKDIIDPAYVEFIFAYLYLVEKNLHKHMVRSEVNGIIERIRKEICLHVHRLYCSESVDKDVLVEPLTRIYLYRKRNYDEYEFVVSGMEMSKVFRDGDDPDKVVELLKRNDDLLYQFVISVTGRPEFDGMDELDKEILISSAVIVVALGIGSMERNKILEGRTHDRATSTNSLH